MKLSLIVPLLLLLVPLLDAAPIADEVATPLLRGGATNGPPQKSQKETNKPNNKKKKHCKKVQCLALQCADGERSFLPDGECCPVCLPPPKPDCSAVLCAACAKDEIPTFVDGECCPVCEPKEADCSTVRCALPLCTEGYEPVQEGCCQTCQLKANCQIVQCITEPCPPICWEVEPLEPSDCLDPDCDAGFEARTVEGDLCPTCQPVLDDGVAGELEPCMAYSCLDPCYSWETGSSVCADHETCVTDTIYHSGGGPHCPDIGCPHWVRCE